MTTDLSLTGKRWRFPSDEVWRAGAALAGHSGLPGLVTQVLAQRGLADVSDAGNFLNPRLEHLPDPATLKDIDVAVARIIAALEGGERIGIFGDYDVDGTCATAMLVRYFRQLGTAADVHIPDRLAEGYGLNTSAMEQLAARGVKLLITVDTGMGGHEPVEAANAAGMDVIITDHHPQHGPLPKAHAVVNPNRAEDTSALQPLCGTGVAFYVLMALNRALRAKGYFTPERPEPNLTQFLDLVALATVADVMQLVGPNRVLVAKGLQQMARGHHRGLTGLLQVAGVREAPTAGTLGFALGPRLNAAGRIENARAALELLLCDDDTHALQLAGGLDALNRARQEMEKAAVAEAVAEAESMVNNADPIIVVANSKWHPGVVGLVASRVKDRTGRAVFALGGGGSNILKGSGRSLEGLDLGAALAACKDVLISGGGHAMAAGATLDASRLADFRHQVNEAARSQLAAIPGYAPDANLSAFLAPTLIISGTAIPASITANMAETLQQLAPFGNGNPEPLIALEKSQISYARTVGATQEHVKLTLKGLDSSTVDAIAFGVMNTPLGPLLMGKAPNQRLTLAGHVRLNRFGGTTRVDFQIVDGKIS